MGAAEEVLLDLHELARGHHFLAPGARTVSDDENLLAYSAGATLPDTAERVTSVEWAADHRTLFFTTEDPVTKRSNKLWRHSLGGAAPQLIYEEKDELFRIRAGRTRDKQYILLHASSTGTSAAQYLPAAQPAAPLRVSCRARKSTATTPPPVPAVLRPHEHERQEFPGGVRRGPA